MIDIIRKKLKVIPDIIKNPLVETYKVNERKTVDILLNLTTNEIQSGSQSDMIP